MKAIGPRRTLIVAIIAAVVGAFVMFSTVRVATYSYTPNRFPEPERTNQIMIRSVAANDLVVVKRYLELGANPNVELRYLDEPVESRGFSPRAIWLRVRGGWQAPSIMVGPTALVRAGQNGNEEMIRLLLAYGADANMKCWWGATPLSKATDLRLRNVIRVLKTAGATN